MIGSNIPEDVAAKRMEDALRPWVNDSMKASKRNYDSPWSNDHVY
jgi:hypothetical protein